MARKRKGKKKQSAKRTSWWRRLCVLTLLAVAIVAGVYYFGSFETRAKIETVAANGLNSIRTEAWVPGPLAKALDAVYDQIPSTTGLIVEGGELGRDPDSPFLAGIPHSRFPIRPLLQSSYINLFNERRLQTACLALRLNSATQMPSKAVSKNFIADPQVRSLTESAMSAEPWRGRPIIPPESLIPYFGETGANDAALATNHAPMTNTFFEGPWQEAVQTFTRRYPARFGEVWIYLGPAYREASSKLASGVAIPDAFYLIALDLTEAGGLRALALFIPTTAESLDLNDYRTSIAQIESLTGLQFLPELDYSAREALENYISPNVW